MYAYLLSTLPSFDLDDAPPMPVAELLERCRPHLGELEMMALVSPERAATGRGESAAVAKRWLDGERQLRNAVARRRAAGWGVAADAFLREHEGFIVEIEDAVAHAFETPDALQREHALDALRWHLLGELAGVVPWGFAAVFAYLRRLEIVHAWSQRDAAEGRRKLQNILDRLEEDHVERA